MKTMSLLLACLAPLWLVACNNKQPNLKQHVNERPSGGAEIRFLYVMQADKAILRQEGDQLMLHLVGADPQTLAFSDRPERIAGNIETERVLRQWSLIDSPPNVAMVHSEIPTGPMRVVAPSDNKGRNPAIALELREPRQVDSGGYSFKARVLGGEDYMLDEGEYREVSLFVDDAEAVLDCSMCAAACGFSFGLGCHTDSPGCQCCSDGKTCPSNQRPDDPGPSFNCADKSTYPSCVTWSRSGGCYNCSDCFKSRRWCSSADGPDIPSSDPSFNCADKSTYPSCVKWSRSGGCYNCPDCFKSRKWCASAMGPGDPELPDVPMPDI